MRFVTLENLKPGMVLSRDIIVNNSVLLERNEILDDDLINIIKVYKNGIPDAGISVYDMTELIGVQSNSFFDRYLSFLLLNVSKATELALQSPTDFFKVDNQLRECLSTHRDYLCEAIKLHNSHEYTFSHSVNVAMYSLIIGLDLGLTTQELNDLLLGALFHDIGKTLISNKILDKPGKLTPLEFRQIQRHPLIGESIMRECINANDRIKRIIKQHHEKLDGSGYPFKLTGDKIDPLAKIVTVADIFDAITCERAYHHAKPIVVGISELITLSEKGVVDKLCVDTFVNNTIIYPHKSTVLFSNDKYGIVLSNNEKLTAYMTDTRNVIDVQNEGLTIKEIV